MNGQKGSIHKVVLFLIVFLFLTFGLMYFLNNKSDKLKENEQIQINWEIPELPEGFNWSENYIEKEESEKNNFSILVEERYSDRDVKEMVSKKVFPPGKLYKTFLTDKDTSYNSAGYPIEINLRNMLESAGWAWSTRYDNYLISGVSLSSLQGNTVGYVKIEQDLIRTYVYSYVYDGNWISSENEPPHLECPCTVEMTVFISDPVPLADFLPAVQQ